MQDVSSKIRSRCKIGRLLGVAALATVLFGCGRSGPAYWPVSGKVTFRGEPVSTASVRFSNPEKGIDVLATLDAEGRYTIITGNRKGVPEGVYRVAVTPKLDFSKMKSEPNGRPIPSTMPSFEERHPQNIPDKYHDPMTSGLTVTVNPESNTFDVDMQ